MNRKAVPAALVAAVLVTGCSGGGGGKALPAGPAAMTASTNAQPAAIGARTTKSVAVSAPAGWAATATQAISLTNATDLGVATSSTPIRIALGLQMRNIDAAKSAIATGQVLSRDAFVATYGPTADQVNAAKAYLTSKGFTNVTVSANNLLVEGDASPSVVASAFNTTLHSVSLSGATYLVNTAPAYVPTSLGGNVVAVLGLVTAPGVNTGPKKKTATTTPPPPVYPFGGNPQPTSCIQNVNQTTGTAVCPRNYDPATFTIAYDGVSTPAATNTKIAIFTAGDPSGAISDWRYNEQQFGLPQVPVQRIDVGTPTSDTSGNGEWTLDLTYSQATAYQPAGYILYNAPSLSFHDLTVSLNRWVSDDQAPVMNASVGGCEVFPYQSGDMIVGDMILVEAAAQGQTLFASTGDVGGFCGVAGVPPNGGVGGVPMVEYPAASPYATAVGGTDLFSNVDGTYLGEDAWQSGGGGLSQFEYSPSWEQGTQPVGTTPAGLSFRGLPDLAADAGLETGALLYESGTLYTTGGTSLASPLEAGVWARAESLHGNALGFAPIRLYNLYRGASPTQLQGPPETQAIGPFHDVLMGTNGDYTALPKYDYTTGLGSLDIGRLATALQ